MKSLVSIFLCIMYTQAFAAYPVIPVPAEKEAAMLESTSPKLAANKRVVYDMYRALMAGQLDQLDKYASQDIINHNPNEESGLEGLKKYLKTFLGDPRPVKDTLGRLVSIFAEGDMVILALVRKYDHPTKPGEKYTSTWFDMFRVVDGLVVEHWDAATIRAKLPVINN